VVEVEESGQPDRAPYVPYQRMLIDLRAGPG
jgi:hypothetical protein